MRYILPDRLTLGDNDQILLCSDGLTDLVSSGEIAATLRTADSSQKKCDALINLALENGGKDNVTALLACYQITKLAAQMKRRMFQRIVEV